MTNEEFQSLNVGDLILLRGRLWFYKTNNWDSPTKRICVITKIYDKKEYVETHDSVNGGFGDACTSWGSVGLPENFYVQFFYDGNFIDVCVVLEFLDKI